jgi:glutamine cyclotransferase
VPVTEVQGTNKAINGQRSKLCQTKFINELTSKRGPFPTFTFLLKNSRLNKIFLAFLILVFNSCNNNSAPDYDDSLPLPKQNNLPAPVPLTFSVENIYPHNMDAFTQGLEFHNGKLYEGTGEPKESRLRIVDLKTGKTEKEYLIPDTTIFGEGITVFKNKIYQLTWQNHKIFVYKFNDISKPVNTYNWSLEGWGITNDGNNLIISNGSSKLYFVQPDEAKNEMKTIKVLTVADNRGELDSLNELEYINGYVYANRWYTNEIIKIDTANGHVAGIMNLTGLLKQYDPNTPVGDEAVLNGIAYDSASNNLYITGKHWPKVFEIRLNNYN